MTSKNVNEKATSENPEIRRLLGFEGNFGEAMGLDPQWAYRIVKLVGNYGEIFDTFQQEIAGNTGQSPRCRTGMPRTLD